MKITLKEPYENYAKDPSLLNLNRLIEESIPLVKKITQRFTNGKFIEKDDLFQEGVLGIYTAIEKTKEPDEFDKKVYSYIQKNIFNYLGSNKKVSVTPYFNNKINSYENFKSDYIAKYGEEPTKEETCEELKIKSSLYEKILGFLDNNNEILENLRVEDDFVNSIEETEILNLVKSKINNLSSEDRFIIESYFGLNGTRMNFQEIGSQLKKPKTKQRVHQKYKKIIKKLRTI